MLKVGRRYGFPVLDHGDVSASEDGAPAEKLSIADDIDGKLQFEEIRDCIIQRLAARHSQRKEEEEWCTSPGLAEPEKG